MGSLVQGRSAIFSLVLSLTLILPWTASATSAVLGIDLGTRYIKAALVKPGIPLEIVPTKDSKRKEISAVAFKMGHHAQKLGSFPERLYGSDAAALAARFPNDVYPNLRSLLGQTIRDSTLVNTYRETYPALDLVSYQDRNTAAFYSAALGKEEAPLTVEELLAMQLQNMRSNAELLAGKRSKIEAVVMTVPSFFTADEIRALELAGELAGLKILGLLSDGLAVGINYATSRIFPSITDGGKAENHLVFDMGAGSTTATVLQFQGRTVKSSGQANKTVQEVNVLGTGYDRFLGGEILNAVIVEHMVDEFVRRSGAKEKNVTPRAVKTHGRTAAKLWKEAERIRQVLSANSETFASFEDLYDNIDFRYKLTRSQFENMTSTFAERVEGPVQQALEAAKLTKNDIDSIILHGGATRTPFVQSRLEKVIGDAGKVRSNVNSDEAAVFGAAFKGAGLSPNFRVKDIQTRDATPYSVDIRWLADEKERRQKIFLPSSQRGTEKTVHFKMLEDFEFTLYQQEGSSTGGQQQLGKALAGVRTQNLTSSVAHLIEKLGCAVENITTSFNFWLNVGDGLPEVVYGCVSCTLDSAEKKGGVVDDVKGFFGFGGKNDEQKPLQQTTSEASTAPVSINVKGNKASSTKQSESSTPSASSQSKPRWEPRSKTEIVSVGFIITHEGIPDVSATELRRMKKRLDAFDVSDRSRRLREESLNTLEAFIYRVRDRLSEESYIAASTDTERSKLESRLQLAADWLYGEGAEASQDDLKARLKELRGLFDPIELRKEEALKRPTAIQLLKEALNQTKTFANAVQDQIRSAAEADISTQSNAAEHSDTTSITTESIADPDSVTTPTSITLSSEPSATPDSPMYTAEDVSTLMSAHDAIQNWLDGNVVEQEKRSTWEDPALLVTDLETKTKELNQVVMDMLQRQMLKASKPKSSSKVKSKSKSKKAGAGKGKGTQTSASGETKAKVSGTEASADSASTESIADKESPTQESTIHDEL